MTKHDLGASVRARLLNQAHAQKRPFQELLQYYAMERFLYRLSRSRDAEQFILKGALLLTAWRARLSRSTMGFGDVVTPEAIEIEKIDGEDSGPEPGCLVIALILMADRDRLQHDDQQRQPMVSCGNK